jgi:hypothetical protein
MRMKEWDPDERIESLKLEANVMEYDPITQARKIFTENAAMAAASIVHLAAYAGNESTRFRAATYITDRVLGPVTSASNGEGNEDPFEALLGECVTEASLDGFRSLADDEQSS